MKWIIIAMLLISCSLLDSTTSNDSYVKSTWEIIENASVQGWSKKEIISKLGSPHEKYVNPKNKEYISWFYFQKKTGFQEWAFTFNQEGNVKGVLYLPKDPHRSDFSIDKIMARWKNLNCEHKKKQVLMPGLIKTVSYVGCDNEKRFIEYNRYKEVESISVEK